MNQIHVWQLGVDICLVMAILVMAFRWMKGSQAQSLLPRTVELEASLRSLIHEADGAGRHLNEQLLRREQNLQKFIADIDAAEQRLTRAIATGEERGRELETSRGKAEAILSEISTVLNDLRKELTQDTHSSAVGVRPEVTPVRAATRREEPPPPAFEEIAPRMPAPSQSLSAAALPATRRPSAMLEEERGLFPPRASTPAKAARTQPEEPQRESARMQNAPSAPSARAQAYRSPQQSTQPARDIQKIYATAEELLRNGKELETVSAQTRIPMEEVRLLSQMIEIEREENEQSKKQPDAPEDFDPRLGALGGIRRQTSTL